MSMDETEKDFGWIGDGGSATIEGWGGLTGDTDFGVATVIEGYGG